VGPPLSNVETKLNVGTSGAVVYNYKPSTIQPYTHPFNGPLSGITLVAGTRKVEPVWILLYEARDSEWQWRQLGHMQGCTSLQTDNHASSPAPHHSLFTGRFPSCCPTNTVKALKALITNDIKTISEFQYLLGKVAFTNFTGKKCD